MPKKSKSGPVPFSDNGALPGGGQLPSGGQLPGGSALPGGRPLPRGKKLARDSAFADGGVDANTALMELTTVKAQATGDAVLELALLHVGESYILGARAPMANPDWNGPWDCAEFVSWCVYQTAGVLFGTRPLNNPVLADAYTGYWLEQAQSSGTLISVQAAANIPGAAVLRRSAAGQIGHIVVSDGRGGTVEAHSKALGVIRGTLSGRRWDTGILVPAISYFQSDTVVVPTPIASETLRVTQPLMRGVRVSKVQKKLLALNYPVGAVDGIYGPQTAHAIRAFQVRNGLVADGEVGAATEKALFG